MKNSRFIFLLALLSFVLLLGSDLIHAGHECSGDDCPVCLLIQSAKNTLASVENPANTQGFLHSVLPSLIFILFLSHLYICGETPVSKKIRKNN
ncbi:MAG: hypothetical protein J5817_06725 [Treponema sp.]|nr:hypothetical protein [Treponema sp.]